METRSQDLAEFMNGEKNSDLLRKSKRVTANLDQPIEIDLRQSSSSMYQSAIESEHELEFDHQKDQ